MAMETCFRQHARELELFFVHSFIRTCNLHTGGQAEGGPAPGGRELRLAPGGKDQDLPVEPHGVPGDVQVRAGE